jgi:hypothetical protein
LRFYKLLHYFELLLIHYVILQLGSILQQAQESSYGFWKQSIFGQAGALCKGQRTFLALAKKFNWVTTPVSSTLANLNVINIPKASRLSCLASEVQVFTNN